MQHIPGTNRNPGEGYDIPIISDVVRFASDALERRRRERERAKLAAQISAHINFLVENFQMEEEMFIGILDEIIAERKRNGR